MRGDGESVAGCTPGANIIIITVTIVYPQGRSCGPPGNPCPCSPNPPPQFIQSHWP